MNTVLHALMGLIVGYLVGVAIAAFFAFVLDLDSAARFIAIGSGLIGAALGPTVANRLGESSRT
jgi:NhaP-type Na+/H+ or K+/H+ antiporter